MPLVEQTFLRPNNYVVGRNPDGSKRLRSYTRDDFSRYTKNTLAWMAAGNAVPLLEQHVPIGETPVAFDESSKSAMRSRGWLKDLKLKADGSLDHITDVTDPDAHKGIKEGSIKFTSPSIEPLIDGTGREFGMGFRHFALTPKPRNPDQTPLRAVAEEAAQFSLDDAESAQMADDEEKTGDDETPSDPPTETDAPENPDLPKDSEAESRKAQRNEAIIANLAQLGVVLPDAVDIFDGEAGPDILLAGLKTAVDAKQKAEVEEPEPDEPEITPASPDSGMQFDESNPQVKALLDANRKQRAKIDALSRSELDTVIAKVPVPGVRKLLKEKAESVQFSDAGAEKPSLTLEEVAGLFKGFPEHLQFSEATPAEDAARLPEEAVANGHVSHSKAEEIASKSTHRRWSYQPASMDEKLVS